MRLGGVLRVKFHVGRIIIEPALAHGISRVVHDFASPGGQICCERMKSLLEGGRAV